MAQTAPFIEQLSGETGSELTLHQWQGAWPFLAQLRHLTWAANASHFRPDDTTPLDRAPLNQLHGLALEIAWDSLVLSEFCLEWLVFHGHSDALTSLTFLLGEDMSLTEAESFNLSSSKEMTGLTNLELTASGLTGSLQAGSLRKLALHLEDSLHWFNFQSHRNFRRDQGHNKGWEGQLHQL